MALFRRGRPGRGATAEPSAPWRRGGIDPDDRAYLEDFVATRRGVEVYVEPSTTVSPYTLVLVAHDGEWTRRPCGEPGDAVSFARRLKIPFYDLRATGYPPRMREWTAARKRSGGDGKPAAERRRPTDEELPPDPFA
jgi:hypothetical protein